MQTTSKLGLNVIEQSDKILNSVTALGDNANIIDNAIATSISSSSTNSEIAGALATYNATLDDYSATEKRVGTWINGKPLYEVTMVVNNPTVQTDGTIVRARYNISSYSIDYSFVRLAINNDGSTGERASLPYITNAGYRIGCSISSTELIVYSTATGFNGLKSVITFCYTKTTDTATRSLNTSQLRSVEPIEENRVEEKREEEIPEEIPEGSGDAR